MKQLTFIGFILLTGLSFFILGSCGSGENKNVTDSLKNQVGGFNDSLGGNDVYYQIPSPEELFAIIRDCKLVYQPNLLNPIANSTKYTDNRAKELNFGVYVADLAYAASFQRYQESMNNIESVRKMSEDIGIAAVFDEALKNRFKAMMENPDSLLSVTNASYFKIVAYLDQNSRGRTLALTATGGWIESMYIIVNLTDKYSANKKAIQRIADQKLTLDNLMKYLEKQNSDADVKATIELLKPVYEVYNELKEVEVKIAPNKTKSANVITVGGKTRIDMTEEQYTKLKQKISDVRKTITGN
jgi:hypothetical protein